MLIVNKPLRYLLSTKFTLYLIDLVDYTSLRGYTNQCVLVVFRPKKGHVFCKRFLIKSEYQNLPY